MYGRFFPRALFGLLVIAGIIGLGFFAYQQGVAQGIAQGAPAGAAASGPYWFPHPFFPFWGFGCLIPLFALFLIFGTARMLFWRGHIGHGHWRDRWSESGVPPMFEEWHKRAHDQKTDTADEPKSEGRSAKA